MSLFTPEAKPRRPYWWDDVVWPDLTDEPPEDVDLLIIGGGYTGLSAAIAAHDAGAKVVVIDSGKPGEGASTRNGGMLGAHPRLGWDVLAKRYGASAADGLYAEAGTAFDWVKEMIRVEQIDCDFEETGRIQLAHTAEQFQVQKVRAAEVLDKGGVPCEIVERDQMNREITTPLYKGGMIFPNHGAVHPAKYLLGMLAAALRRGIPVVPGCPALKVVRVKGAMQAITSRGTIRAAKVLLATNGYTGVQFPWFSARVFPVPSYLIATEPLDPALIARLAPGRRMMVETRARHSYFRVSPDGTRIIFGGRAALVDIGLKKAARRLHKTMVGIWPDMSDVRLSHVWAGNTGYTFGHMPHVAEQDGFHYALGYSGGGTVLAPWLGRKAALQALDLPEGETAYSAPRLTKRWYFKGAKPRFLTPANLWYRHVVDRSEDRAAKR